MKISQRLVAAYRSTLYVAAPSGNGDRPRFELTVGERHDALDAFIRHALIHRASTQHASTQHASTQHASTQHASTQHASSPRTSWAMLTAYNPRSEPTDLRVNRNAHRRLRRRLVKHAAAVWPGVGKAPDGSWSEPMWMAIGLSLEEALTLGREFGQHAILFGERGGRVRLIACGDGAERT